MIEAEELAADPALEHDLGLVPSSSLAVVVACKRHRVAGLVSRSYSSEREPVDWYCDRACIRQTARHIPSEVGSDMQIVVRIEVVQLLAVGEGMYQSNGRRTLRSSKRCGSSPWL